MQVAPIMHKECLTHKCRHLVGGLQELYGPSSYETVCERRGLDPDLPLANTIREHAAFSKKRRANLHHVVARLQHTLACLPTCDSVMHVNYIWQVHFYAAHLKLCVFLAFEALKVFELS